MCVVFLMGSDVESGPQGSHNYNNLLKLISSQLIISDDKPKPERDFESILASISNRFNPTPKQAKSPLC